MGKIDFQPMGAAKSKIDFQPMNGQPSPAAVGVTSGETPAADTGLIPKDWDTARQLTQSFANAAPFGGMAAGGFGGAALAGPAAPLGAVAGAAGGGMAGEGAKELLEHYLLGKAAPDNATTAKNMANEGLSGAMNETTGQALAAPPIVAGAKKVASAVGGGLADLGSTFTGIPAQAIKTFANDPASVLEMYVRGDKNLGKISNQVRDEAVQAAKQTTGEQNKIIETELANAPDSLDHDVAPVLDSMGAHKARFNPGAQPEQVGAIENEMQRVKAFTPGEVAPTWGSGANPYEPPAPVADNRVNLTDLNRIVDQLQQTARPSYQEAGQIFPGQQAAQDAAKSGGAVARELLHTANPTIGEANAVLQKVHQAEDVLNPNMITPEAADHSLYRAGSDPNSQEALAAQKFDSATGANLSDQANKLAAAKYFGNAQLLPVDGNGRAAMRIMAASGVGSMAHEGLPAMAIAMGLSSPKVLKNLIRVGAGFGDVAVPMLSNGSSRRALVDSLMPQQNYTEGSPWQPQK